MNLSISIEPDEDGYTGRECPVCEKYFKIKFGTGLPGDPGAYCPYCNHHGPHKEFWTKEQIEYARSLALNKISGDLLKSLKKLERKSNKNSFISIGITVKGNPTPIAYYTEKELEEQLKCDKCTLEYSIFGAFGYCPDCGTHNSKQILSANFDLTLKILTLASNAEKDIKSKLIENALEDCISAFDGYAREQCANLSQKISFQNIRAAQIKLLSEYSIDISGGLNNEQWTFIINQFQKRHLLAHKFGVIDEEFIKKTNGDIATLGRKISITESDVIQLIENLNTISSNLSKNIERS